MTAKYKQIGNAVPVNMAEEIGYTLVKALNDYYALKLDTYQKSHIASSKKQVYA